MNAISDTAYYCCGVRMEDAMRSRPLCGDHYAQRFMDERGRRIFAPFRDFKKPNACNVARHRIIDDCLRRRLAVAPTTAVLLIGCGFDSRAYRLASGRWFEFDEPPLIEHKNRRLPVAECPNPLQRIPVRFEEESLVDKLPALSGSEPVVVVIEGVFMYLSRQQKQDLLRVLRGYRAHHDLICDLMNNAFFQRYGRAIHERIERLGVSFTAPDDAPEQLFQQNGYRTVQRSSIVARALAARTLTPLPGLLLKVLLPGLWQGYSVWQFELPRLR